MTILLLDIAPELGAAGIAAVVGFFLIFVAVAYVAFRLLKRTVRMALRMAIVAVILLIAVIGSIYIYWKGTEYTPRPRPPAPTRQR
jgi:hypothetical protein